MFSLEPVKGRYITGTLSLSQLLASGAISDVYFTDHTNLKKIVVKLSSQVKDQEILIPFTIPEGYNGTDALSCSVFVSAEAHTDFSLDRVILVDYENDIFTVKVADLQAAAPSLVADFDITFTSTESGGPIEGPGSEGFLASVTPGVYENVTVDAYGRVIAGTNPTTLVGYGITDAIKNDGGVSGIKAGSEAQKNAIASPVEGLMFAAVDSGIIYIYSMNQWVALSDQGAASVSLEESARIAADTTLTSNLSSEQSTRISEDVSIRSSISAEQSARVSADTTEQTARIMADSTLTSSISAEQSARIAADIVLQSHINTEQSARIAGDAGLQTQVDTIAADLLAEQSARTSTDVSITTSINTERSARIAADAAESSARVSSDTAEQTARILADANLQSQIDNIVSNSDPATLDSLTEIVAAFQAADGNLTNAISALGNGSSSTISVEQSARIAADGVLQDNVDAVVADLASEVSRATAAEGVLTSDLASEVSDRNNAIVAEQSARNSAINSAIITEISNRNAAIAVETSARIAAISAEESARIAADATLQANIDAELSARLAAETLEISARTAAIAVETSARSAADSTLNSAISAEQTRAQSAESTLTSQVSGLQNQINNIVNNTDPAALDSLTEVVAAFEAADSNLNNAITAMGTNASSALGQEITRAEAAEGVLTTNLSAEQSSRISADNSLQDNIDAVVANLATEQAARIAADNVLTANLATEQAARIAADNVLTANLATEQSARIAADNALATAASAEQSARIAADDGLATAASAEQSARIAADNGLQAQITALNANGGGALFQWNVNGSLLIMDQKAKRVDGSGLYKSITPSAVSLACSRVGTAGTLTIDVRKHQSLNTPIMSILPLFQAPITSILAPISAISTQSIAAYNTTIATQSITRAKTGLSIQSIIKIQGTDQWKYSFSGSLLDADYQVGKSVLVAGATNAGNNGTFTIVEVNHGNLPSIVVTNASGVAQTAAAGTLDLQLFSYNYASAVSSDYVAGDNFLASSHTTAANNGSLTIYKINQNGNNILVYNATGVTQASVLGTAITYLFKYNYSSAVDATYFKVGEKAKMASHTNGANNGNFAIRAINSSGNNIVVYNTAGVVQAGVAGNSLPNRFNVNFATNPTSFISVGDTVKVEGNSTTANNGSFSALVVASTYVTVYNESGAALASASGTFYTCKYKVTLNATVASLGITTSSNVEMIQTVSTAFEETDSKAGYNVLAVGTSDFTILDTSAVLADFQLSPAGYISLESKSILSAPISIASSTVGLLGKELQIATGTPIAAAIPANTWLGVWVTSNFTAGTPRDISIALY